MISIRTLSLPVLALAGILAGCSAESGTGAGAETSDTARNQVASQVEVVGTDDGAGLRGPRGPGEHHVRIGGPFGGPSSLIGAALHAPIDLTAEQRTTIEGLMYAGRPAPDANRAKALAAAIRSGNVSSLPPPQTPDLTAAAASLKTLHDTLTASQRAALVADIQAHEPGPPPGHRPANKEEGLQIKRKIVLPYADDLELTDAQKEQLKARVEANLPKIDEARLAQMKANMEAHRADMKAKLESFKADSFDATAFVTPPASMKAEANVHIRANPMADLVAVLTPEQREKLAQKIEQGPPAHAPHAR